MNFTNDLLRALASEIRNTIPNTSILEWERLIGPVDCIGLDISCYDKYVFTIKIDRDLLHIYRADVIGAAGMPRFRFNILNPDFDPYLVIKIILEEVNKCNS